MCNYGFNYCFPWIASKKIFGNYIAHSLQPVLYIKNYQLCKRTVLSAVETETSGKHTDFQRSKFLIRMRQARQMVVNNM